MTCDEVRELLPEQLLGTLEGPEDLEVRRHLRGCSTCREERMKLEDGVAALSRAVHDQEAGMERRLRAGLVVLRDLTADHDARADVQPAVHRLRDLSTDVVEVHVDTFLPQRVRDLAVLVVDRGVVAVELA
jgi:anti-sigma factor RsiW